MESTGRQLSLPLFEKCVRLCYNDAVLFQGKFYKQKTGSPTGHPISSSAQNIIMSALEEDIIIPLFNEGKITLYERWVDDTSIRLPAKDVEIVLARLNSFDSNLNFTCEKPSEIIISGEIFNFIPFLDIGIYWNARTWMTKVYRKATTSKIVMPFNEFGPYNWKKGTLIFFVRRAITHSSDQRVMHEELELLAGHFKHCGYPAKLVHSVINTTITQVLYPEHFTRQQPNKNCEDDSTPNRWTILHMPWFGLEAGNLLSQIQRAAPRQHSKVSVAQSVTKIRHVLPRLDTSSEPPSCLMARNCVYKYECDCGEVYIGETLRRLAVRAKEHSNPQKPLMKHISMCGSSFSMNNFRVIARGLRGREARKRCEALFIKFYGRRAKTVNIQSASRELVLF